MKDLTLRQLKLIQEVKKVAQDFFGREATSSSLITVTNADIAADIKHCTIYITVLPEKLEEDALNYARRMRAELRTEIKKKMHMRSIPFVEIEIDRGERYRQKIETLLIKENIARPFKEKISDIKKEDTVLDNVQEVEKITRLEGSVEDDKLNSEMD
jgi:ribosome-binding factor A